MLPEPYMERFAQLRSKYAVADYGIIERKCQSFLLRNNYPFPELRVNARGHYSDDISKWFGRFLDSLNKGIKAKADKFEEGHVFHSFRHTVRTEFRNNEANPEFVTRIQGWERGSSLSEHYGEVSLKVLRETVNCKLKYEIAS